MNHVLPIVPAWWPEIAATLPLPWSREAVLVDLRWWTTTGRIPDVDRVLRVRWGWKRAAARLIVRTREWHERSLRPPRRGNRPKNGVRPSATAQTARQGASPNNRDTP